MRVSRWGVFAACVGVAACGGAIAPTGGQGDGGAGGGPSSSGGGSSSGVVGGSSGSVAGGSSTSEPSSSGSSGSGSGGVTIDAAFACSNGAPPPMTGNPTCDQCVEGMCGDSWCACSADSPPDDAGGIGGCLSFVNCVVACIDGDPDAGVPTGTVSQCAMLCSPSYGPQQQQEGATLLSCLAASCNTAATCP